MDRTDVLTQPGGLTPGVRFNIHYCDFNSTLTPQIKIDLYYGSEEYNEKEDQFFFYATNWMVTIQENGSGYSEINSSPTDPLRDYMIYYKDKEEREIKTYFSLVPGE